MPFGRRALPARSHGESIQNEAAGFGVEGMSRAETNEEEKSGRNRLTVWTLSGMTDLWLIFECRHFDFGVNASDADRCVILMAPDFQQTCMGGGDLSAQRPE